MVKSRKHECSEMNILRYQVVKIGDDTHLEDGWYLKKKEFDYYWLKWTDSTMFKIKYCPFCGKEL